MMSREEMPTVCPVCGRAMPDPGVDRWASGAVVGDWLAVTVITCVDDACIAQVQRLANERYAVDMDAARLGLFRRLCESETELRRRIAYVSEPPREFTFELLDLP